MARFDTFSGENRYIQPWRRGRPCVLRLERSAYGDGLREQLFPVSVRFVFFHPLVRILFGIAWEA